MTTTAGWTGEAFAHEAFVYDDAAQLRERVVPFVAEALAAGEPLVVVVSAETAAVLRDAFGERVDDFVVFEDAAAWWRGDAYGTLLAYADAMLDLMGSGRPWRLVGEPVWLEELGGDRWSRLESACNESFAELPYYSLCLHDRRRLSPASLDAVARTHPTMWAGGHVVPCDRYERPAEYLRSVEPAWADGAGTSAIVTSPAAARAVVTAVARRLIVDVPAAVLVASELASNALVVAAACTVGAWVDGDDLVIEVRDDGAGFDATLAGYVPPLPTDATGRGLWMVRQLADDLSVRSTPTGTVARAYLSARSA